MFVTICLIISAIAALFTITCFVLAIIVKHNENFAWYAWKKYAKIYWYFKDKAHNKQSDIHNKARPFSLAARVAHSF